MEQNHQERRAAAKEFLQSLNHLEDILQENPTEDEAPKTDTAKTSDAKLIEIKAEIDLEALEDAVADIEQYLGKKLH